MSIPVCVCKMTQVQIPPRKMTTVLDAPSLAYIFIIMHFKVMYLANMLTFKCEYKHVFRQSFII